MNLSEKLELYTSFSQGENNGFSKLEVADLELVNFDLKPYDLSNSYFGGVTFTSCDLKNVDMHGSNFGGSKFISSILKNNNIVKAEWDNVEIYNISVDNINAFRTTFMESIFNNCKISQSNFESCNFWSSRLSKVTFEECNFVDACLNDCIFTEVIFKNCILPENFKQKTGLIITQGVLNKLAMRYTLFIFYI